MSILSENRSSSKNDALIKTIVIEDEAEWQTVIEKLVKKTPELTLKGIYADLTQAKTILEKEEIDLVLLDVELNQANGVDFIKKLTNKVNAIIISSHSKYAIKGYEIEAIDFLEKPIEFEKFDNAIQKAIRKIQKENQLSNNQHFAFDRDFILIKKEQILHKISFREILYVVALENYIKIYTPNTVHLVLATLMHFEKILTQHPFLRVHRSYIVNLNTITQIEKDSIILQDETKIPLGGIYKEDLHEVFIKGRVVRRHI